MQLPRLMRKGFLSVARDAGGLLDRPRQCASRVRAGHARAEIATTSDVEKIADCEVVIVAATPLRKAVIDAATHLELVHHQGVGWQDTTDHEELKARGIPLALTPEGTTTRRRRAHGAADPGRAEVAALCRQRAAAGSLSHQRSAAGIARAAGVDSRLRRHGPHRASGGRAPARVRHEWNLFRSGGGFR